MNVYHFLECEVCSAENEIQTLRCAKCDADLTICIPQSRVLGQSNDMVAAGEEPLPPAEAIRPCECAIAQNIKLVSCRDGFEIAVPRNGGIIGRTGTLVPEYFADMNEVSRTHATISRNEEGFWLTDHSSNKSRIENDEGFTVLSNSKALIRPGDRVSFASATFLVVQVDE